jgi:transcriptional regulator with GAF, ATPase, and Fis domain
MNAETDVDAQLKAIINRLLSAGDKQALRWPELQERLTDLAASSALQRSAGSISSAARLLGMERHQLAYHLKRRRIG